VAGEPDWLLLGTRCGFRTKGIDGRALSGCRLYFLFFVESRQDCVPSRRWAGRFRAADSDELGQPSGAFHGAEWIALGVGWRLPAGCNRRPNPVVLKRVVYTFEAPCGANAMILTFIWSVTAPTFGYVALDDYRGVFAAGGFRPRGMNAGRVHDDHGRRVVGHIRSQFYHLVIPNISWIPNTATCFSRALLPLLVIRYGFGLFGGFWGVCGPAGNEVASELPCGSFGCRLAGSRFRLRNRAHRLLTFRRRGL